MAACCRYVTRSAAKVFSQVWLKPEPTVHQPLFCLRWPPAICLKRHLHWRHTAALTNMKVKPQKAGISHNAAGQNKTDSKTKPENEEEEEPEYIPKRKAKNPMMKIGYAWMIGLPTGIIGFILAKREVDKNRLKQLRIRQRMKKANEGDYERTRYTDTPKME